MILLCLIFPCLFVLTACNDDHVCSWKTEWLKDSTHHWHACSDSNCLKTSNKIEHVWDAGEIVVPATNVSDGVKTFCCIDCGQLKNENISYEPRNTVSLAEWNFALNLRNFQRVRYDVFNVNVDGSKDLNTFFKKDGGNIYSCEFAPVGNDYDSGKTIFAFIHKVYSNENNQYNYYKRYNDEIWKKKTINSDEYLNAYFNIPSLTFNYTESTYNPNTKMYEVFDDGFDYVLKFEDGILVYVEAFENGILIHEAIFNYDKTFDLPVV